MIASTGDFDRDEAVDLRGIVTRLWTRRSWIAGSTALIAALFALAAFIMTPVYRSSVVVVSASVGRAGVSNLLGGALGSLGDLASLAGVSVGAGNTETEEALAVLRSRQFTEAFIEDRHLMPVLYSRKWDAQTNAWKADIKPPTPAMAYKYFDKSIRTVSQDKKTGLITLQIDWRDRTQGAQWANDLIGRVNAEMRSRAIEKADASMGYLEKELTTTPVVATREAINRLIEAQIKQRMLANVTQEYAFRVVDRAMPPDEIDVLKPKKLMMIAAGLALGALIGVFAAILADSWSRTPLVSSRRV